ncbi:MAG: Icc protein [Pseudohongiellaceae bacterium]|jgi:Icc protein
MDTLAKNNSINIVQITDTHLYGVANGTLLKMNTQESFAHVLRIIKQNETDIDVILATGDIAQDASVSSYEKFIEMVAPLKAPFYWIPGNHDITAVMNEVAKGNSYGDKLIHLNNWLIVMLDTSIAGQVHGRLSISELDFLDRSLRDAADNKAIEHCLICLHHNPVKTDAKWMGDIGLHNDSELFAVLNSSRKVRALLYGHIHQELDFQYNGLRCLCTPSTCIQFKPAVTNFELDDISPGYRNLKLFEDGTIETEVFRVTEKYFEIDLESDGY